MKKLLLALLALQSSIYAGAQMFDPCDDMVLIPIGSPHRPDWNKERLLPYVVHDHADGHRQWFFDGFLMGDGFWMEAGQQPFSFGEADWALANRTMWEKLADNELGVNDGLGCKALDDLIGELIPELGAPSYKHQFVISLPVPHKATATWGKLDGEPMNFIYNDHKLRVCKWYVDYCLDKIEAMDFKNIEFAGFFYIPERVYDSEVGLAVEINKYIHQRGTRSFFIPYYNAPNYARWAEFGFDLTYIQPNYFFAADRPMSRLTSAIDMAWDADCGLEMEFEGINYDENRQPYFPNNCGLYDRSPAFYQRFVDYVEKFEEGGAFDFMPLSYYTGYQAVYDFTYSKNPKDNEIMHRLAANIEKRHIISGWHEESASISDALIDRSVNIYAVAGGIYVDNQVGSVDVYSLDGRLLNSLAPSDSPAADSRLGRIIYCPAGIYIVKTLSKTLKVCVN